MTGTDHQLFFSAGSVDITPRHPIPLAGYVRRTGVYDGVSDRLEANAILLRQGSSSAIILSLDLLYVGKRVREELLHRLGGRVGAEDILLCATHTHFAPATDGSKPLLGILDERYVRFLVDQLEGLVRSLLEGDLLPGRLVYDTVTASHSVNRRLFRQIGVYERRPRLNMAVFAPNPGGPRDDMIRVLCIEGPSGEAACVLWNYCCHPVGTPSLNRVSADYPGAVRRALREAIGQDLSVLFLQGFAGDIRPREFTRSRRLKDRMRWSVVGPFFSGFREEGWRQWTDSLSALVVEAVGAALLESVSISGGMWSKRIEMPLDRLLVNAPKDRSFSLHCLAIGQRLRIVGISAEVVVDYGQFTESTSPGGIIIPVGYTDDVFGYLPTENMIEQGGYEAGEFLKYFSLAGPWSVGFESECRNALRLLMEDQ